MKGSLFIFSFFGKGAVIWYNKSRNNIKKRVRVMKYYGTNGECVDAYIGQWSEDGRTPNSNMYFVGDVIYSYGPHFPMAVRLSNGFYVVNGDRYSVTTSQHQRMLFTAIPNRKRVEIPYSALFAALGLPRYSEFYRVVDIIKKEMEILDWVDDSYVNTGKLDKDGNPIYDHVLGGCLFKLGEDRKFLSSMDESGTGRGLFFLTELADNNVTTIEEAYESLKPEEVKKAEKQGKEIRRQGEHFFIKIEDEDFEIGEVEKRYLIKNKDDSREDRHFATEGFERDGRQFVRGVIRHSRGEHSMLKLYEEGVKARDRKWYEQFENIQINSWSAGGSVD